MVDGIISHMEMRAFSDGHDELVVSREEFHQITRFLGEALEVLARKPSEFRPRVGIAYGEAESLSDERLLIRYQVLNEPRPMDRRTGRPYGPTEPRKTGTDWDHLPKIKARIVQGSAKKRLMLTFARDELSVFANCIAVTLQELVPTRSRSNEAELFARVGATYEEAELLMARLRRTDRVA